MQARWPGAICVSTTRAIPLTLCRRNQRQRRFAVIFRPAGVALGSASVDNRSRDASGEVGRCACRTPRSGNITSRDTCPIRVFSPERAAACRRQLEAAEAANGGPLPGRHEAKAPSAVHLARRAGARLLDAVEGVIGPDILCWASSFFTKEAHDPSYVSWHQDLTYWGLEPADIVTAWIALSPSTPESGCMRVVPGSHKRDVLPHTETFTPRTTCSRAARRSRSRSTNARPRT